MSVKEKKKSGKTGNINPFCLIQEYYTEYFPSNQTGKKDKKMKKKKRFQVPSGFLSLVNSLTVSFFSLQDCGPSRETQLY